MNNASSNENATFYYPTHLLVLPPWQINGTVLSKPLHHVILPLGKLTTHVKPLQSKSSNIISCMDHVSTHNSYHVGLNSYKSLIDSDLNGGRRANDEVHNVVQPEVSRVRKTSPGS